MPRNLFQIAFFVLVTFLVALPLRIRAEAAAMSEDDIGCHQDDVTESYVCDSGPLLGREFLTLAEAQEAFAAAQKKTEPPPADEPNEAPKRSSDRLRVMSWNMKALAKEGSDYDRAAIVLADADIIALQEVELKGQGKGFINVLANLMQAKSQDKFCRAWVQAASGERQSYGFIWRDDTIGLVDSEGEIKESCGDAALTIRQSGKSKLASHGTFYFKSQKKMFVLGMSFSDRKLNDKNVSEIFKSFDEGKWPVVVTGDLKLGAGNPVFSSARKLGYHSALSGNKKAWDNIWYRSAALKEAKNVNLYERFPDARQEDIKRDFAEIFPVMAEFNLRDEEKDTVSLVSKTKPVKKKSGKQAKASGSE